jgi:hypothetical protein
MTETITTFPAFGQTAAVAGADAATVTRIRELFELFERTFFTPESELARINTTQASVVSPLFARALEVAERATEKSGGILGFTIEGKKGVGLKGQLLYRPQGVILDLSDFVKSMAVDEAAALLEDGFVSCGGDLATRGLVQTELPGGGSVGVQGGMSVSGRPADLTTMRFETPWQDVAVVGPSALVAGVAAKTAFRLGEEGLAWLDARSLPGRLRRPDGTVVPSQAWQASGA